MMRTNDYRRLTISAALCIIVAVLLASCTLPRQPSPPASPPYTTIPAPSAISSAQPTDQPTPAPTDPPALPALAATPTECVATGYNWAYGSVTPAFAELVQRAFDSTGIKGRVEIGTYGETDGCRYGAMSVDYGFTVEVGQLDNSQELKAIADQVLSIALGHIGPGSAPNLGNLQLTFHANGQSCGWSYRSGAWEANPASSTAGSVQCAVP